MSLKKDKKSNKEKIKISRLISNVFYVLAYAMRSDKKMIFTYIIGACIRNGGNAFLNTFILKEIIDSLINHADIMHIAKILALQFVLNAVFLFINIFTENYFHVKFVRVSGKVQRDLMEKAVLIDLNCYDCPGYYDDFVIAASQCEQMIFNGITSISYILGNLTAMLVAGAMIMMINPVLALFPIVGFVVNIITRFAITKLEYKYELEKQKIGRKADYSKRVFYQPEYAKEIKLTSIEDALKKQYNEAIDEQKLVAKKYGFKIAILSLINWIFVFTILQFFSVPAYLAYLAIEKASIALGDVASLKNATNNIKSQLDAMNYALVEFQNVGQYAERFRRFMEYEVIIETSKGTKEIPQNDTTITFNNVSYKYKDSENYVLKDINLTIQKGEKVAIVGENGAGKTTLIKLIMRLYDVTDGAILFGGTDIRDLDTKEYRHQIGAVFQDFQIFAASVSENVKMDFVYKNDINDINNALEKADFSSKLQKMSDGINTELTREFSDCGTMLSGGESQKVAISRMFVGGNSKDIAILDEPSSALDPMAEYTLNKNMLENASNRAVILISHRLSTTKDADRIILLEKGRIAEEGSHCELLEKNGKYAQMWRVQAERYCPGVYS